MRADCVRDCSEEIAHIIWKACPFRSGNRAWLLVLLQGYSGVLLLCFLLACVLNSVDGEEWLRSGVRGNGLTAKGNTALDECFWFVFTTVHSIGFGEFMPRSGFGRVAQCLCISLGYWMPLFLLSIVTLSQLAGERTPSLYGVVSRMACAVWPSYSVFIFLVVAMGSQAGPYVSSDRGYGWNVFDTGIFWMWQVAHRMPFGDLWPNTPFGRTLSIIGAMLGNLYIPYALAVIAVRRPTKEGHRELMANLREHPEDSLGRGYIAPPSGGLNNVEMQMSAADHTV
jgi:hypothetical protein